MHRKLLVAAIGLALTGAVAAEEPKSPHSFRGGIELETRSNDNIALAPSSNDDFDFASVSDFGAEEDEAEGGDEDEDEDEDGDDFEGDDYDEDELEEDDAFDEDGDGIDDLLDGDSDGRRDSEQRTSTKLNIGHKYAFDGGNWGTSLKVVNDFHHQRDELNKVNWAVGTGPELVWKERGLKFKPQLSYVMLQQDNSKFLSTLVGTLALDIEFSKAFSMDVAYNYQDKDVSNPDSPDAIIDTLTIGAEWKASKNDIFKAKFSPKVEDSTQVTRNKDTSGWQFTYSRKLPWDMVLGLGVKDDSVDYKNLRPVRRDDIRAYAINLEKEFNKQWAAALAYETRDRESNIDGKDGKNQSVVLSVTRKF